MTNPYNLKIKVKRSYPKSTIPKYINVLVWRHHMPEIKGKPIAVVLSPSDSINAYEVHDHYRVYRAMFKGWAEPVGNREKKYPHAKKALFRNKLLREHKTKYYQLIYDEFQCCTEQLRKLYNIE